MVFSFGARRFLFLGLVLRGFHETGRKTEVHRTMANLLKKAEISAHRGFTSRLVVANALLKILPLFVRCSPFFLVVIQRSFILASGATWALFSACWSLAGRLFRQRFWAWCWGVLNVFFPVCRLLSVSLFTFLVLALTPIGCYPSHHLCAAVERRIIDGVPIIWARLHWRGFSGFVGEGNYG